MVKPDSWTATASVSHWGGAAGPPPPGGGGPLPGLDNGNMSPGEIQRLFDATRDADYAAIAEEARALATTLSGTVSTDVRAEAKAQLVRLKARHAQIFALDFFGADGREAVDGLIAGLEAVLAEDVMQEQSKEPASRHTGFEDLKGCAWVTRQGVHVDRIACAWLIRRFLDSKARFRFVDPQETPRARDPVQVPRGPADLEARAEAVKAYRVVSLERPASATTAARNVSSAPGAPARAART